MAADINDNITDFGDLVSVEVFTQIANNLNYLIASTPVGETAYIVTGLLGQPAIDMSIWQVCDGNAITDPLSPLFGQNTRDLRDRYLKCTNGGGVGTFGGSNTVDITHTHSGVTSPQEILAASGDFSHGEYITVRHTHAISGYINRSNVHVSPVFNAEPVHICIRAYLKIR